MSRQVRIKHPLIISWVGGGGIFMSLQSGVARMTASLKLTQRCATIVASGGPDTLMYLAFGQKP